MLVGQQVSFPSALLVTNSYHRLQLNSAIIRLMSSHWVDANGLAQFFPVFLCARTAGIKLSGLSLVSRPGPEGSDSKQKKKQTGNKQGTVGTPASVRILLRCADIKQDPSRRGRQLQERA